jgi:hypothetical protein
MGWLTTLLVAFSLIACSRKGVVTVEASVEGIQAARAAVHFAGSEDDSSPCQDLPEGAEPVTFRVNGKQSRFEASTDQAVQIFVNGNLGEATLTVRAEESVRAICVRANGNRPKVTVIVEGPVETLLYEGTGNESRGIVRVTETGRVGSFTVRLGGNQSALSIEGEGEYVCPADSRVHGNSAGLQCVER